MISPAHGGTGEGLLAYALVLEELAAVNIVLWPPVLDAAIAHAIAIVGPDRARARWLPAIAAGESHIGLAVTEPDTGHNVFRSRVTVEPDDDGFVVDGLKGITSGTDLVDRVLVFVHRTAARFDARHDGFLLAGEANMAKVLAADLVFDAADRAVHTLGASAWDQREGIIDLYLDARCSRSAPVSQELALNFIAQHVLGLPSHR